jgi:hypothetical protein
MSIRVLLEPCSLGSPDETSLTSVQTERTGEKIPDRS